ncbi:hypothetical protein J8L85_14375 [Maribacter sp. MMG018]|uniref:lipopolysaccharide biosynthesis protein n=1 Tax=Maribacter sp. MMG018 TaxID=2822688 RepID=UPI001B35FF88|nr:hypothetical protein [Maribacter sp. MMG018]MBQ4915638.1 hypothetical protein [Maribacter sp. MMG018]
MSRLANTIKNARVGIFFHALFVLVQFFSRKIFLDDLGDDFMGTTATLYSFLNFLNLAELGIGSAIGFALYRPIYNKDHKKINHIIGYVGNLYKNIGLLIIAAAIILSAFFPIIFEDSTIPLVFIYYAFFAFLMSSLLGYFFNYHIFLLQADQKDYIVAKYFQSFNISKIIIQAVFVYFFQSFFIWITLEVLTGIIYTIIIRKKIRKEYPWLDISLSFKRNKKNYPSQPELLKKIKQISVHKLGGFLNGGTDNILIFYFISAQSVAFFGNYQLIILNLGTLVEKIFAGSKASIGNLVAENNEKSIHQVLWEMMSLRFFIGGFAISCILLLINPFITLWLGEKYVLENTVVGLFCLLFFIRQVVNPIEAFKQAYGLYSDTWAPITEGILNLVVSIVFAQKYGLAGILLGTNVSIFLIVAVWRPIYVYKSGFKKPIFDYIKRFAFLTTITTIAYLLTQYLTRTLVDIHFDNYYNFTVCVVQVAAISMISFFFISYSTNKYFRDVLRRLKNQLIKKSR